MSIVMGLDQHRGQITSEWIDTDTGEELRSYARRQAGCKALMAHYGIGPLVAVTILAELGECTRFSSSRHAVRYSGLDITVHQSDQRGAPGHLSRQGPPALRWATTRYASSARRHSSPHEHPRGAQPFITQMPRGRLPASSCRHRLVDGPERPSGRNACTSGITPSNIMSPAPEPTRGSWTEVRLGARAHTTRTSNRAHAPPRPVQLKPDNPGLWA